MADVINNTVLAEEIAALTIANARRKQFNFTPMTMTALKRDMAWKGFLSEGQAIVAMIGKIPEAMSNE